MVTALPRGPQLGRRCTGYTLELPRGGARSMPERGVDVLARARQRSPRGPARPRRRVRSIVSSQTANARRSVRYARAGSLRRVHRARGSGRSLRRSRRPHSAATRPCLLRVPGAGGGRQPLAAPYPYGMPGRRFDSQVSDDVPKRPADPAVRRANLRRIFPLFRPYWRRLSAVCALIFFAAAIGVISPFLLREVLDVAISRTTSAY